MSVMSYGAGGADTFPPDFRSPVGMIRALIPDVEQVDYDGNGVPSYMFSDPHLMAYYTMAVGDNPSRFYRAGASALRALAVSEGLIQKVIRTEDLQTDGAKLATALLAGAKALEERAIDADDEAEIMMVVDFQPLPMDAMPYDLRGFPTWWTVGANGRGMGFGWWLANDWAM
jgi:hypothetical protein